MTGGPGEAAIRRVRVRVGAGDADERVWIVGPGDRGCVRVVGSGAWAGWRVTAEGVRASHLALWWDGAQMWAHPLSGEVCLSGAAIRRWRRMVGGTRLGFGAAVLWVDVLDAPAEPSGTAFMGTLAAATPRCGVLTAAMAERMNDAEGDLRATCSMPRERLRELVDRLRASVDDDGPEGGDASGNAALPGTVERARWPNEWHGIGSSGEIVHLERPSEPSSCADSVPPRDGDTERSSVKLRLPSNATLAHEGTTGMRLSPARRPSEPQLGELAMQGGCVDLELDEEEAPEGRGSRPCVLSRWTAPLLVAVLLAAAVAWWTSCVDPRSQAAGGAGPPQTSAQGGRAARDPSCEVVHGMIEQRGKSP